MNKIYVLALSMLVTANTWAANFALEGGFRSQSASGTSDSLEASSKTAFQFGGTGSFELNGPLALRAGVFYTQRPVTTKVGSSEGSYSINYFDLPVALQYQVEDFFALWAGAAVAVKLDSKCEIDGVKCSGSQSDVKDMVVPISVGTSFKFAPQIGGSLFFEMINGKTTESTENYRAVGANISVFFE